MKFLIDGDTAIVLLSRRNLESLLSKLSDPYSLCTITQSNDLGQDLVVKAEPDEVHYVGRTPGPMHPRTELTLAERKLHEPGGKDH